MSKKPPLTLCLLFVVFASDAVSAEPPGFLSVTPRNRVVIAYVNDLVPHLERAVKSEGFRSLADSLNELSPSGRQTDPDKMLMQLREKVATFIPTEIAITVGQNGVLQFTRLLRVALYTGLCNGAIEAEDEHSLKAAQKSLLKDVQQLALSDIEIWVNFRTPVPAILGFGQLSGIASNLSSRGAADVKWGENNNSVRITAKMEATADSEEMKYYLKGLGILDDWDSEEAVRLGAAVSALTLDCRVEKIGNAIRVSFGSKDKEKSEQMMAPADLGDHWQAGPEMISYLKYDAKDFRRECIEVLEIWDQWAETETGKETSRLDDEDLIGTLKDVVRQLRRGSGIGELAVSWDNDRIRFTAVADDVDPLDTLKESGITKFLPNTPGLFHVTTAESLADFVSNRMNEFEDRLASRSLKYDLSGKEMEYEITEQVTRAYYGNLAEFRKLIKEDAFEVFQPPYLALIKSDGRIDRFKAKFQVDGVSNEISGTDLPFLHFAFVGRLQPGKDGGALAERIWAEFLKGISGSDGIQSATLTEESELASGVVMHAFNRKWQKLLPEKIRLSMKGDALPHYFRHGKDWFVFSTSPRLSEQLMGSVMNSKQYKDEGNSNNQAQQVPQDLLTLGGVSGDEFAGLYEVLSQNLEIVLDGSGRIEARGDFADAALTALRRESANARVASFLKAFAGSLRHIGQMHWQTSQKKRRHTTTGYMSFRAP